MRLAAENKRLSVVVIQEAMGRKSVTLSNVVTPKTVIQSARQKDSYNKYVGIAKNAYKSEKNWYPRQDSNDCHKTRV